MTHKEIAHPSSFRDPSGYIFEEKGICKRVILPSYFKQYTALKNNHIFKTLFEAKLLIPHKEVSVSKERVIIEPENISFITYPYEWCFNQYKEAALLTLKLQKFCIKKGFSLKDATAFNVTFHNGRAVFIDTLSFDFYIENSPWRAYKQFVMHFLGPLILAKYHGSKVLGLLSHYIDGIPLQVLSSMLPFKTKLIPLIYTNIHLLAKFEKRHHGGVKESSKNSRLTKKAQLKLLTALFSFIKDLELDEKSEWGTYYSKTNYSEEAFSKKSTIINNWVNLIQPRTLIDIGGNDGTFVRAIDHNYEMALIGDIDNSAIDINYKQQKLKTEKHILPFVLNVLNPSPSIGFQNRERESFINRIKKFSPDLTLALAIIHHITLSGNVPFELSAQFFSSFSSYLIIEFPRREDSWVKYLLQNKGDFKDHFDFYNKSNFETTYSKYFKFEKQVNISNSNRILYLLKAV